MTPEEMVSRLLYRDGLMLVLDKPAGMAVHRGSPNSKDRNRESIEDHFDALRFGLPRPPALAHRLDRDTTGCLVLGRHRKALAQLGKLFRNGAIDKTYWAVVEGGPDAAEGEIDMPLGRLDDKIGWWQKHDPKGQPAVTKWRVMGRFAALTWLALEPLTGRTHQLRVHCAETGWPILGDAIYGNAPRTGGPTLHLHAREIIVPLYKNRPPIQVVAPVPEHMRERLTACGWRSGNDDARAAAPASLREADAEIQ
ncbi:MAG TPA: RNA pseudouridine synthase [Xanthobacteraceae bacterium]|nr:RNA pseudouridine synthase [Xanthobacteraceae bacterium]